MAETTSTLLTALFSSFTLVSIAEIGDKSQLVCIALSARYKSLPVLAGVVSAFALLNALAVIFGAIIADVVAPQLLAVGVALLFFGFGIQTLREHEDTEAVDISEKKR